ncbi:component of IIS longevity pathway SMK-1-domain-containing protein [Fomitopsis betulina]|nr:component of IIS longevity pathway SMK-1-domain-containing protein [Fomitopsis betulina]
MSSVHAAGSATETQTQTLGATLTRVEHLPPPLTPTPDGTFGDGVAGPSLDNDGRVNSVEKADTPAGPTIGPGALQPGERIVALSEIEGAGVDRAQGPVIGSDESGQWTEDETHELKRVKVYELIGSRWVDQGTAFCFGDFQDNEAQLIARSEANYDHIILSTTIRTNDVYQRQQDTLIVWTEPDGVDYALSFQDPEGCSEVWLFIQEVQRHMSNREETGMSSSPVLGSEPSISTASILRSGHLPQPQLDIISEIERVIKSLARTNSIKERICEYIQTEDYIKALINVMTQAEEIENLENLHALCSCMQTILMLNDHSLYEHILEDDIFFGVVGMLEYDPEFPAHKANYREFLHQTSRFHMPVPLRDETIQKKIHHTYRLQFLKDVVLARAIDDSTFNVLNSCIIFNQIDIINHVQNDPAFLLEVVCTFLDDNMIELLGLEPLRPVHPQDLLNNDKDKMDIDLTQERAPSGVPYPNGTTADGVCRPRPCTQEEITRAREIIFLIQQLCVIGKNVQLPARMALFRALVDRGILFGVQWALSQPESDEDGRQMIAAAGEILTALLDHDLNGVRGHILKQVVAAEREKSMGKKVPERETMLFLMCRVLVKSRDLAVQSQLGESIRTMLETQQEPPDLPLGGFKTLQRDKDAPGVERFLDNFYKFCIDTLFRPFGDIPIKTLTEPRLTMSRERTNLFLYLCDLLSVFTLQHSFRSHFFILSSNVATRVASLLTARDKHLRLAAFRFFRACVKLNNHNMFNHFFKHEIFLRVLNITAEESRRDTLLSASCQELFEYMRKENMKEAINHCMTVYGGKVRALAENPLLGPRFQNFIRRWEMNNASPPPEEEKKAESPISNGARRWGQGRFPEAEEEDYFNADDDEEVLPIISSPPPNPRGNLKRKRAAMMRRHQPPHTHTSIPPSQPLSALVAYDDNDDPDSVDAFDSIRVPSSEEPPALSSPSLPRKLSSATSSYFPTDGPPASPRMSHKQIPPKPMPSQSSDEQDDLLEQLFNSSRSSSPSQAGGKPPELGAKRRREDDDDELLERLATRAKRPSISQCPENENTEPLPIAVKVGPTRQADEGPKKIKVKFGAVGAAVAASPSSTEQPAPSDPGAKEGDNG